MSMKQEDPLWKRKWSMICNYSNWYFVVDASRWMGMMIIKSFSLVPGEFYNDVIEVDCTLLNNDPNLFNDQESVRTLFYS